MIDFVKLTGARQWTHDGKMSRNMIEEEILDIVHEMHGYDDAERIQLSVIKSFSKSGLIEIYNQLGHDGLMDIVRQTIKIEIQEMIKCRDMTQRKRNLGQNA